GRRVIVQTFEPEADLASEEQINMRLLAVVSLLCNLYCCLSASVFVDRDEANTVFSRFKRANSGWLEELKAGNLERECLEEQCSYEEAREVFEHSEATDEFWKIYNVKDFCASSPCENNGLCSTLSAQTYTCLCSPGYSGRHCELATREVPDSCLYDNGGCEHFCQEELEQRNCSCADGYFLSNDGHSCQSDEEFPCGKIPFLKQGTLKNDPLDVRSRIVGGAECPKGHCPWQVLLKYGQKGFCGGVIYNHLYILTAAHCLENLKLKFLKIVAGEHDLEVNEGTEQTIAVAQMIPHPEYVPSTADNDIALLRLSEPIIFDAHAIPVCLPQRALAERELWAVSMHTVSGWGKRSEDGPTSRILRRLQVMLGESVTSLPPFISSSEQDCFFNRGDVSLQVPRIRTQECVESSNVSLSRNMFCAGFLQGEQDSCKGDSGGPLTTLFRKTHFLLGIVSWGKGCARPGAYGIYTRISNYLQWIQQNTLSHTHEPHMNLTTLTQK
ncbi:hypothetical protein DNTS_024811, partial [Danionella cerebrum]